MRHCTVESFNFSTVRLDKESVLCDNSFNNKLSQRIAGNRKYTFYGLAGKSRIFRFGTLKPVPLSCVSKRKKITTLRYKNAVKSFATCCFSYERVEYNDKK